VKNNEIKHVPLVSIGMPIYNGEKYIRDALDSLLNQTFADFELIISDNASTDNTSYICKEYASKDHRIQYIRQESNIGPSKNFSFVLQKSIGNFFMWASHDDTRDKNWIEKLISFIDADDIGVIGVPVTVDENNDVLKTTSLSNFTKGDVIKAFLEKDENSKAFYMYALYNREILEKTNIHFFLQEDTFAGDQSIVVHLVQYGNLRCNTLTSLFYRQHGESVSAKDNGGWLARNHFMYHFLPFSIYACNYNAVSGKYKILLILSMPIKYFSHQLVLLKRAFKKYKLNLFS
jgi:glycosyltransferase involved in cell wall biosynthesis